MNLMWWLQTTSTWLGCTELYVTIRQLWPPRPAEFPWEKHSTFQKVHVSSRISTPKWIHERKKDRQTERGRKGEGRRGGKGRRGGEGRGGEEGRGGRAHPLPHRRAGLSVCHPPHLVLKDIPSVAHLPLLCCWNNCWISVSSQICWQYFPLPQPHSVIGCIDEAVTALVPKLPSICIACPSFLSHAGRYCLYQDSGAATQQQVMEVPYTLFFMLRTFQVCLLSISAGTSIIDLIFVSFSFMSLYIELFLLFPSHPLTAFVCLNH